MTRDHKPAQHKKLDRIRVPKGATPQERAIRSSGLVARRCGCADCKRIAALNLLHESGGVAMKARVAGITFCLQNRHISFLVLVSCNSSMRRSVPTGQARQSVQWTDWALDGGDCVHTQFPPQIKAQNGQGRSCVPALPLLRKTGHRVSFHFGFLFDSSLKGTGAVLQSRTAPPQIEAGCLT